MLKNLHITGAACTVWGRAAAGSSSTDALCWPPTMAAAHLWNRDKILRGETTVDWETAYQCQGHGTVLFWLLLCGDEMRNTRQTLQLKWLFSISRLCLIVACNYFILINIRLSVYCIIATVATLTGNAYACMLRCTVWKDSEAERQVSWIISCSSHDFARWNRQQDYECQVLNVACSVNQLFSVTVFCY